MSYAPRGGSRADSPAPYLLDAPLRLLDAVEQALVATDPRGVILLWNPAAERLYGWERDEAVGRSVLDVLPARVSREEARRVMERLRRGERWTGELAVRRRDGSTFLAEVTASPVLDDAGALLGIAATSVDLTERKRVEAALREEAQLVETLHSIGGTLTAELDLQTVVQAVTDAATSLTGAQFGAFFYNVLNERGESYTLYTISGVPREAFSRFPMPRNTPIFAPTFYGEGVVRSDDITRDPRYGTMEPHRGMPAGHLPVRSYLAVPVHSRSGSVLGGLFFGHADPGVFGERDERIAVGVASWAAVAMDNAHLYHAEQKARTEAEAANRAKSDFLAVMSHELRTPLGAILGYTDILSLELAGPVNERQREHLGRVKASARHLLYLIDEVLTYSRLEADKEEVRWEAIGIDALVGEVATMIEPLAQQKELRFQVHLPAEAPPLETDPGKLRQILLNLLSNAVKFTPAGTAELRVALLGDTVRFQVRDTGIGIPAEHLERIFEPFWQVDQGTTRSAGGTGLGLSVVRRLARMMGGEVTAESAPGQGSTFTVCLPLRRPGP